MAEHLYEWDQLNRLINRWQKHCLLSEHDTEAPFTKYDRNLGNTWIKCVTPGCSWLWDSDKHAERED